MAEILKPNDSQPVSKEDYDYGSIHHTDSIRLLTLHPGGGSSPLSINLQNARLQDYPVYETVSYTWAGADGDASRSVPISCDGYNIWITKNCELTLRAVRKKDVGRVLWVDSICINQDNIPERGQQVALMGKIYSRASRALIWLGEASKDIDEETSLPVSNLFLDHLSRMMLEMRELEESGQHPSTSALYQKFASDSLNVDKGASPSSLFRGFKDIVERPWWKRIWVVQEAFAAAGSLLISSAKAVSYSDFYSFYIYIKYDPSEIDRDQKRSFESHLLGIRNHFSLIRHSRKELHFVRMAKRMDYLLSDISQLQATDARHKIYGILRLYEQFAAILPSPDYNKTMADVYIDVVKAYVSNFESLNVLELVFWTANVPNLPSWIPNWSVPRLLMTMKSPTKFFFKPALDSKPIYMTSNNDRTLRVKGKLVGRVEKTSATPPATYKPFWLETVPDRIPGFRQSCELGFGLATYPTGEAIQSVIWQTLCMGFDYYKDSRIEEDLGSDFEEFLGIIRSSEDLDTIAQRLLESKGSFYQKVRYRSATPLCITTQGLLASAPYMTEIGDSIVIFAGGDMPYVLRATGDTYRLMGHCYVHGIMDGEIFPEDLEELEWFSIT